MSILFPILNEFPLNIIKHLDYLSFKKTLELSFSISKDMNFDTRQ